MSDFILGQEIVINPWLFVHIFLCSKLIWGERAKKEWFPINYFSYIKRVCGNVAFVGMISLWGLAFTVNIFYIAS